MTMIPCLIKMKVMQKAANDSLKILDEDVGLLMLLVNINDDVKSNIIGLKSATAIWNYLVKEYASVSSIKKQLLLKKLTSFQCIDDTLAKNLQTVELLTRQLTVANGGDSIKIKDLSLWMLLFSLPAEYGPLRTLMESNDDLTFQIAKDKILLEEAAIQGRESVTTGQSLFAGSKSARQCVHKQVATKCWTCDPRKHPDNRKCKDCTKTGHYTKGSKKCALFEETRPTPAPVGGSASLAYNQLKPKIDETLWASSFVGTVSEVNHGKRKADDYLAVDDLRNVINGRKTEFVMDSGATSSIVSNKQELKQYTAYNFCMKTANGGMMRCPAIGTLNLNNLTIVNVLFARELTVNLISISQLCDMDLIVTFTKWKCEVTKSTSKKVVLDANRTGGLYIHSKRHSGNLLLTTGSSMTELAHRRLMHLNYRYIKLLSHMSEGLTLDAIPSDECLPCVQAKSHRHPFKASNHIASRIGELVHTDECEVGVPTIVGNFKYFVTFTDDFSRFTTLYLLKHKSDATAAYILYNTRVYNLTNRNITTLRSDGGGEFFNTNMKEYCAKLGTFQQRSTRGTPQQNARAERPNRWIIEGANAALLDANLHISFWGYAVVMKVWLKNRSPHAKLHKQTPFERWTGSKPDLSKLHVFGTTGYAHIPKDFRKKAKGVPPKFINHAKPMIFVAYSEVVKGYTMFDPDTRTELDCSEVTFPDKSSKYVERDLRLTTNASVDTESTLLDHMVSNEFIETIIDDEEEIAVPANGTIHPKVPVNGTAQTDSDNESQIEESEPKPSSDNEHETDTLDQYQNDSNEDEITNYGHSYLIEQAMNG
jgi:hypothetical protein